MKYFTIKELSATSTGLANTPNVEQEANLKNLVEKLLDPLRKQYGKPIRVNSGFRNLLVNTTVGGATNSQHLKGEAADITGGNVDENRKLFDLIKNSGLLFDQLIDEQNYRWIHVSLKSNGVNRKQILHLS